MAKELEAVPEAGSATVDSADMSVNEPVTEGLIDESSTLVDSADMSVNELAAEGLTDESSTLVDSLLQTDIGIKLSENEILADGGVIVWILLVMSIIAVAIVLMKWAQFSFLRINSTRKLNKALAVHRKGRTGAALNAIKDSRQPTLQILDIAFTGIIQAKVGLEVLREDVTRTAAGYLENLRGGLRVLEVIATLSPLLGLLGTVLGMIEAFQQMELAGAKVDPSVLSGGISQALLTTAAGLGVAIPAVAAHNWLESKVDRTAHMMEDAISQIFTASAVRSQNLVETSTAARYEQHNRQQAVDNKATVNVA